MDDEVAEEGLRSIELLRHLPQPAAQFDASGAIIIQNPESYDLFGRTPFVERFADRAVGQDLLTTVLNTGVNITIQAQQQTLSNGIRWFDVQVKSRQDPVTAQSAILYSARDITAITETEAKSELLSVIAHEIRTPLHQLMGFSELLELTTLDDQQEEYASMIKLSCICMMGVINDVLDFSKVESGKLTMESIPFELRPMVEGTVSAMVPIAEKKGLAIKCFVEEGEGKCLPQTVLGDPSRMRQVLTNLLNNAIKFTDSGSVTVTMTSATPSCSSGQHQQQPNKAFVRFAVQDTGIGISPEGQAVVFEKYRQASDSVSRKYGGTGLGLAICKSIVELMGGEIGVESTPDEGSTFWFSIPFDMVESRKPMSPIIKNNGCGVKPNDRPWKILVAEDNVVCQKLIIRLLRKLGHTVQVVGDGAQAVAALGDVGCEDQFDLVLMDSELYSVSCAMISLFLSRKHTVQMPVLDGIEATKQICASPWGKSIPVVGLTADFLPAELSKYQECGMVNCLGKPTRIETLRNCIHDLQAKLTS